MLRFSTAGESHGESLVALVSGLPAGVPVDQEFISHELWRRQRGYGRGGRMRIERDSAHILSGVRHGKTIGSPVAMTIANNDWKNWTEILPIEEGDPSKHKAVASPRPGHADLAGALKYNFHDARYVLERASARESSARVASGALAKLLLRELDVHVLSHVIRVGKAELSRPAQWDEIVALSQKEEILLNCVDPGDEARMKAEVDAVLRTGDTVGGVFEVVVHGLPPGVGTHVNWDERLDGLLAQAVMSLQAVKAVEIGRGVTAAESLGSTVHDAIGYEGSDERFTKFSREHNNAGGIEGGISNGEDVVVRGYLKPISTLRRPLGSVSFETREPVKAAYERSDVCVVPAAGVASEAMVALTVARLVLEKFGGDSLGELRRNYKGYLEQIRAY
ncbi:chorismate synthase [Edaphobacter sp. 12200R-103]|jgi:chorismate synthase|uniref:chorismate synthase n=1 Tax=Edaphobacter sp. 12200R-103 TaxID=2703788 RepID=UPI00138D7E94|nr:chorismate synthase [Edaphobacter sp. 12200R-103]QHS50467.1 chorismate synthase [Edaphobacter sp. 12200R-103]